MTPAILVLDVETTGKDRQRDQIVELVIQLGIHDGAEFRGWRIQPTVPIHPEAQAIHGITMESLAGCRTFGELAPDILAHLNAADVIVGYNIRFDIEMLQAELDRHGMPMFDFSTKKLVDAFRLWQSCEPRSLMDAHRRFVGGEFQDAHSAVADVAATSHVLTGMLQTFGLGSDWDAIAAKADPLPERWTWLGPTNHFQWDANGSVVFGFGKHKGAPVISEPDFLRWIMRNNFPETVREVCAIALQMYGKPDAFSTWAQSKYPRRAQAEAA